MTKAALNTFSKYLSAELKPHNIAVTAAHPGIVDTELTSAVTQHRDQSLGIACAKQRLAIENKYVDVALSAKFLTWLLLDAEAILYTGDIIGIYNQRYQPLWHDSVIPSPYPDGINPP